MLLTLAAIAKPLRNENHASTVKNLRKENMLKERVEENGERTLLPEHCREVRMMLQNLKLDPPMHLAELSGETSSFGRNGR